MKERENWRDRVRESKCRGSEGAQGSLMSFALLGDPRDAERAAALSLILLTCVLLCAQPQQSVN